MKKIMQKVVATFKASAGKIAAIGMLAAIGVNNAMAVGEPLDLTTAGTTLGGYVATAAGAGVLVFIAIRGVRVIKKAFSAAS